MPELPEVETVRIGLGRLINGKYVSSVSWDWEKSFPNAKANVNKYLIKAKILGVERRAKILLIRLSTQHSLVIHLKMTGQLVFRGKKQFGAGHPTDSLVGPLPDKSTRVIIKFSDGSNLYFNDQRKFGWVRLLPNAEIPNIDFMKKLGPEPLSNAFSTTAFRERLNKRPNSSIKAALLDQSVVAGIGNIYADESLWEAKIHPATPVKLLSTAQINRLFKAIRSVLLMGIAKGGSTDRNYVDARGKKGSYLKFAQVFRREGQACPRCGHIIIKTRVAGRGTHFCPHCQRLNTK
jgi:formamidopyrimidine-DNA glycosylase